jgi:TRAP-type mannitol/chloroaromatic compound transport system permease small subunit
MGALLNLASVFDRIARTVGKLAGWIILPLIFVIIFDVVTRKVDFIRLYFSDFSINYGYSVSTMLQDLEWHLHGVLLLLTFGFGYLMNAHVRVDIFRENLSRKGQAWLEFLGLVLMALPFLLLMLYYTGRNPVALCRQEFHVYRVPDRHDGDHRDADTGDGLSVRNTGPEAQRPPVPGHLRPRGSRLEGAGRGEGGNRTRRA